MLKVKIMENELARDVKAGMSKTREPETARSVLESESWL